MCVADVDDARRDTSAPCEIENGIQTHQLTNNKKFLIDVPSGVQKDPTARDQTVNAREISLDVAELLFIFLRSLLIRGLIFLPKARNCCFAFLRCVRVLWPKHSLH